MKTGSVPLARVVVRSDCQSRADKVREEEHIADLCRAIEQGDALPPVDVVAVTDDDLAEGEAYVVTDGAHRHEAHVIMAQREIAIRVVAGGDLTVARWWAARANLAHGKRRTSADKREAVRMAIAAKPEASSREIARHVRVSHSLVNDIRATRPDTDSQSEVEDSSASPITPDSPAALSPPMLGSDPEAPGAVSGASPDATSSADGEVAKGAALPPDAFAALAWCERTVDLLREAHRRLSLAAKGDGPMARTAQAQRPGLKKVLDAVRLNAPVACPRCEGRGCDECQGRGWVRKRSLPP